MTGTHMTFGQMEADLRLRGWEPSGSLYCRMEPHGAFYLIVSPFLGRVESRSVRTMKAARLEECLFNYADMKHMHMLVVEFERTAI